MRKYTTVLTTEQEARARAVFASEPFLLNKDQDMRLKSASILVFPIDWINGDTVSEDTLSVLRKLDDEVRAEVKKASRRRKMKIAAGGVVALGGIATAGFFIMKAVRS